MGFQRGRHPKPSDHQDEHGWADGEPAPGGSSLVDLKPVLLPPKEPASSGQGQDGQGRSRQRTHWSCPTAFHCGLPLQHTPFPTPTDPEMSERRGDSGGQGEWTPSNNNHKTYGTDCLLGARDLTHRGQRTTPRGCRCDLHRPLPLPELQLSTHADSPHTSPLVSQLKGRWIHISVCHRNNTADPEPDFSACNLHHQQKQMQQKATSPPLPRL